MEEIIVRLVNLPTKTHGFVLDDPDGNHNVYINGNLCKEDQIQTFFHEMNHIRNGHLYRDMPVREIENETETPPPGQPGLLFELRRYYDTSVESAAHFLRVPPSTLLGWESGAEAPDHAQLEALARLYDVSVYFLKGEYPRFFRVPCAGGKPYGTLTLAERIGLDHVYRSEYERKDMEL